MKKRISIIMLVALVLSFSSPSMFPLLKNFPQIQTQVAQAAATSSCSLDDIPATLFQRSGEDFQFKTTIGNTGADPGFSPAIELVLPSAITLNSATFSIGNLALTPVTTITVTDNDGGSPTTGTVTNPLTHTTTVLPVGNVYRLYRLPLGSFVPGQTLVSIEWDAHLSSVPPINIPLTDKIQSRCEFVLGSDPLDNPDIDAPVFSSYLNSTVVPTLLTATKLMVTTDGEDETATGENFPVTYTIGTNIANTKTITDVTVSETLPNTEQLLELTSQIASADQITFTPSSGPVQTFNSPFTFPIAISAPAPGGSLSAHFPSVTGTTADNDAALTFKIFVPDKDASSVDILPPNSGGSVNINNISSVNGTYLGNPVSNTLANPVVLAARALATQKGHSISTNTGDVGYNPGDTVQYTINFQVSDYFTENNLVVEDLLPDGMTYEAGSARLSLSEDGSTNSALPFTEANQTEANVVTGNPPGSPYNFGLCSGCNLAITPDTVDDNDAITPPGDGRTVMAFDVSSLIDSVPGEDNILQGGMVGPTPAGQPTRGTITYRALINENFIDTQPHDKSIDADDVLTNTEKVSAQVLNPAPTPTGNYTGDGSSSFFKITAPFFSKDLWGYIPDGGSLQLKPFTPTPLQVAPNDESVYKLTVDVPSGDLEELRIKDYLPIPFFDVNDINTTFDPTVYTPTAGNNSTVPPSGNIAFGSGTTGLPPLSGTCTSLEPVITKDTASNTFLINWGNSTCFEKTPSTPMHIELFFTMTAKPKPMANSLKIVNLATYSVDDSTSTDVNVNSAIIDILTVEPELHLKKGIISTDKAGATFTPVTTGPVAFTAPGTNPPFVGPFSSTDLATSPIDSNISNVDAGDKIRFAATLDNQGGAKAYDVTYTDLLPPGFSSPASIADLNLKVYDASGTDRTADTQGGLFGFAANGGTSFGGDTSISLKPGTGFTLPPLSDTAATREGQANEGKNILVVTYELKVDQTATAYQVITNTGKLTNYASLSGSFNYVDPTDPPSDTATTTLPAPILQKIPMAAPTNDQSFTTCASAADCRATIGEPIQYRIPVTLPEGNTTFTLNDNIPAGLGYYFTPGITMDGTTANCPEATSNFTGTLPTISGVTPTITGPVVAPSGTDLQATFTGASVTNNNNINDNTFCIFYQAVVTDPLSNPTNKTNSATITVGSTTTAPATAIIRAKQPILNVTKVVNPTSGDAGNVVTYTMTISHAGTSTADATDVSLSDILPAVLVNDATDPAENFATDGLDNDGDGLIDAADPDEVASTFYNSGTQAFTFNKATTNNTSFDRLPLASTIVLTFKAKMLIAVKPSQIITNTATIAYDSIPGVSVTGIDKGGANNGSADLSVVNVTAGKVINGTSITSTGTSQHNALNTDLTIGEQVTYRITVGVPEATTSNLVITDNAPSTLRIDSASLISDATGSAAPVIALADSNADAINDRATITFATVTPPAVPSGTNSTRPIVIDVLATVVNQPANSDGQVKTNNVSVNWTGNSGAAITAHADADIVEPNLSINKTFIPNTGDAGDIITFALQANHNLASTSSAYDVAITDAVPSSLTIQNFGTDGIDNDGNGLADGLDPNEAVTFANAVSGQNITLNAATTGISNFNELALGNNITYQVRAQLNNTVFPGQAITNTANLTYDSAPGVNPDQRSYNTSDNDTFNVSPIIPIKTVFSTDLADTGTSQLTPADDLAIGETVTYRVAVNVPESNADNFTITDTLPNRFQAISGSLIQDDGVGNTFTAATLQDNLNGDGINDTVVFNFGNVTNPPDADTETIIVEVVAKVINNPANITGTYTNSATVSYTQLGAPVTATVDTDVVEPSLAITKSVTPLTGDSGDQFEYTINITNTGTASAYDLEAVDNPDNLLTLNSAFATDGIDNNGDGTDGDANEVAGSFYDGDKFTWNTTTTSNPLFTKLDPLQTITLKYQITLPVGVTPNEVINNLVNLTYDSFPGANPDQRTYTNSANANITVSNNADISKTLGDADVEKVIGETVPYIIKVRVPEGTVDGLVINDTLPAGLAYIPGSAVAGVDGPDGADVTWDGTPTTPGELPLSTAIGATQSQALTFNFGNVINTASSPGNDEFVTIAYTAVVMNTADNNNNNTKQNSASAVIGTLGGTVGPVSAPPVTIIEPALNLVKSSSYALGSTITYQLRLENNATSPEAVANDVVITDLLPAGLTYVGNLNLINGPALPTVDSTGAPTIKFSFPTVDPANNSSNPIIFTFDAQIANGVTSGTILTNNSSVVGSSLPGTPAPAIAANPLSGERTGSSSDPGGAVNDYNDSSNLPLTVSRPNLSTSFKSVTDLNGGTIEANDTLKYHIEVINTGNSTASGIHLLDNLPVNVHNFNITTLPITGTNNSLPAPAGSNSTGLLDFTNLSLGASGSANDTEIIEFTVQVDIGLPDGTNIVNNFSVDPAIEGGPGGGGTVSTGSTFPILSLNKVVVGPTSLNIGQATTYQVTVGNSGSSSSTHTTLIDPLPPQMEYVPGSLTLGPDPQSDALDGDTGDFSVTNAGAITFIIPSISVGQTKVVTYGARPRPGTGGQSATNTVTATDDQGSSLSSSANVSIIAPPGGGAGGPFGGGGGSGGSDTPGNSIQSIFEDQQGNQNNQSCETKVTEPEIIPTACLQLVPNRDLNFTDLNTADASYIPFINTLKNTEIIRSGDFVFSGDSNHSSGKQQVKFQGGQWQFEPDRQVTRLEAVKTALISNCIPIDDQIKKPASGFEFADMPAKDEATDVDDFATKVFYTAYEHGIISGDNGKAKPYDFVSTPELLAISLRASGAMPTSYDSVSGPWYAKYEKFARDNGLLNNTTIGDINSKLIRKDLAKILVRVMAYNPDPNIYGYIERVDLKDQTFDWKTPVLPPEPAPAAPVAAGQSCPIEKPVSCLVHDPSRPLIFDDSTKDNWAAPYVDILRTTKIAKDGDYIASGHGNQSTGRQQAVYKTGDWSYDPDTYTTRLEAVKTALVSNCISVEDQVPIPANGFRFSDLPVNVDESSDTESLASRIFYTAYEHGIITGENLIEARPFDPVTRVEAMTILTRASKNIAKASLPIELPFVDTSNGAWYGRILSFAWENGLIGGDGEKLFQGDRKVKRDEMAKLIYSFMLFNDNEGIRQYAQSLKDYYKLPDFDIIPGTVTTTINPIITTPNIAEPVRGKVTIITTTTPGTESPASDSTGAPIAPVAPAAELPNKPADINLAPEQPSSSSDGTVSEAEPVLKGFKS